jgi:hypothetical protein
MNEPISSDAQVIAPAGPIYTALIVDLAVLSEWLFKEVITSAKKLRRLSS